MHTTRRRPPSLLKKNTRRTRAPSAQDPRSASHKTYTRIQTRVSYTHMPRERKKVPRERKRRSNSGAKSARETSRGWLSLSLSLSHSTSWPCAAAKGSCRVHICVYVWEANLPEGKSGGHVCAHVCVEREREREREKNAGCRKLCYIEKESRVYGGF